MPYLKKLSTSDALPVSVARAKERLRIDHDGDDADLERLILAAAGVVENHTGRTLRPCEFEMRLDDWPSAKIEIPVFPVRSIEAIAYFDEEGDEQTIAESSFYWLDTDSGAELHFTADFARPTLQDRQGSIRITIAGGYEDPDATGTGDDPMLEMPDECELAILFLVGTWYDAARTSVNIGNIVSKIPHTFEYIAAQLRIYR